MVRESVSGLAAERMHYVSPDYSQGVAPERKSNAHIPAMNAVIEHVMSCPACATGGACRG